MNIHQYIAQPSSAVISKGPLDGHPNALVLGFWPMRQEPANLAAKGCRHL